MSLTASQSSRPRLRNFHRRHFLGVYLSAMSLATVVLIIAHWLTKGAP